MSEIKPALSAEEWPEVERMISGDAVDALLDGLAAEGRFDAAIAAANAALPDGDPRKITREHVELLRRAASAVLTAFWEGMYPGELDEARADEAALGVFADAMESYLPPEGT